MGIKYVAIAAIEEQRGAGVPDVILTDPQGRDVLLRDSTWRDHILVVHPELVAERRQVELAIADPMEICESRDPGRHPTGVEYYGPSSRPRLMVKVATEVVITRDGLRRDVKTAHLVKRVTGGKKLWP